MIKYRVVVSLLFALCLPLLSGAVEDNGPPSSVTIYQTLDQLWGERQFDALDEYVTRLGQEWNAYVPAQLAKAIYSYNNDVDIEAAIKRLEEIRAALRMNIALASPLFMELLDSRILRYRSLARWYSEKGLTRDRLIKMYAPREMDPSKLSKHWGDEMLFFNAPEVFLTKQGVLPSAKGRAETAVSSLEHVPVTTLQGRVGDEKQPMTERKLFAQELVRRRAADGGVSNLVQSLRAGDSSYTYHDTVEALVEVGASAIPELVRFINDPAHLPYDQKMAIWVLVRIGVADPDVIQTLQSVSSNTDRADLAKYAQDALQYLQAKDHD